MKKSVAFSAVLFSLLLWSCGGDDAGPTGPTTTPKPTPVATSVTLSVTSLSLASLGVTSQLSATVKDQSGATMASATVTWATSDAAVATVSSAGLVTSVADGTVTITATSGSLSATASVTVAQAGANLVLSDSILTFASLADTTQVTASVTDANGETVSGAIVTWATSDAAVATVSSAGLVTSVADGGDDETVTITATSGSLSATAAVTVAVPASLELSDTLLTFSALADTTQLTATVKNAAGSTISGATVTWASSDTTVATVSSAGLVTSVSNGTATITATSGSGSATAEITVNYVGPTLGTITATWTEGAAATITGSGFSATASSNTVTVDGLTASITSASTTELQITVPTAACKPSRVVDLVVTVVSESATATVGVKPESVLSLGLGDGYYTVGRECLHLAGGTGSEEYMIGFFNTSESPSSLTPVKQTAIAGTTLAGDATSDFPVAGEGVGYIEAPIIALGDRPESGLAPPELRRDPDYDDWRIAHAEWETQRWERYRRTVEEMNIGAPGLEAAGATARAAMPARSVGDTIVVKVTMEGNLCTDIANGGTGVYSTVTTVVTHVGTSAIYMEDIDNPLTESFTAAEYAAWDVTLSGTTLPTLTNYFGDFVDGIPYGGVVGDDLGLDADGRVGVVLTKEVNKLENLLGFVSSVDLVATSVCPISNQAELFYGRAPDPDGLYAAGVTTKAEIAAWMPSLIAHEVTHILQGTQELFPTWTGFHASWEKEAGATLAEQLVGMAVLGHESGQNLGQTEWLQGYYDDMWYKSWAGDLRQYFGLESINSPEECTWLIGGDDNDGPCWNGRAVYGVPATLLRLILDQYGPSYAGGEAALMRDMTNSTELGYANLEARTGKSIGHLLSIFGMALWADGRGYNNSLTSWDLYPIMEAWSGTDYKLQPDASSGTEPTADLSVRGGSTGYLRWSPPSSHAPTSIRIRTPDGDELPDEMGFWIMRIG